MFLDGFDDVGVAVPEGCGPPGGDAVEVGGAVDGVEVGAFGGVEAEAFSFFVGVDVGVGVPQMRMVEREEFFFIGCHGAEGPLVVHVEFNM